jgi:E3 ubiquitin-protein ligase DOA10
MQTIVLTTALVHTNFDATKMQGLEDCAICLERFNADDDVVPLPCNPNHYFHAHCITKWIEQGTKAVCPLCRGVIDQTSLSRQALT